MGLSVRTLERWEKDDGLTDGRKSAQHLPSNKLTLEEYKMVLDVANSPVFQNLPPCKIVPLLADEGRYIASESTFYRILRAENQLRHRQASRPVKHHRPKAYHATGPNQVWTWDISFLPTTVKGLYFYLYFVLDIYSRKIVGWAVHDIQLSEHGAALIKQACMDEDVRRAQLVLHSDNGTPMKGVSMLAMLENLGVVPSFNRPSVSNDNPYSEALFRTVKYRPEFPLFKKFEKIEETRIWCEKFVVWYNQVHLHSALKFLTPK